MLLGPPSTRNLPQSSCIEVRTCDIIFSPLSFADFRNYMSKSFPSVLNGFYWFGEKFGDSRIRQIDQAVWAAADKKTGTADK